MSGQTNKIIAQTNVEILALHYFTNGLYCSEAILKAFNEEYELKLPAKAMRMATGFGTGFGNSKCSCGCITGAILVTSSILGRTSASKSEKPAFEASKEIHDTFKDSFKYTCCRALTKDVEWGSKEHHEECQKYVIAATRIAEEIVKREYCTTNC